MSSISAPKPPLVPVTHSMDTGFSGWLLQPQLFTLTHCLPVPASQPRRPAYFVRHCLLSLLPCAPSLCQEGLSAPLPLNPLRPAQIPPTPEPWSRGCFCQSACASLGICRWVVSTWLSLALRALFLHLVLPGSTGAGHRAAGVCWGEQPWAWEQAQDKMIWQRCLQDQSRTGCYGKASRRRRTCVA